MTEPTPLADPMTTRDEPIHPQPATPADPGSSKPRSELTARIFTGMALAAMCIYAIYVGGLWYLAVVTTLIRETFTASSTWATVRLSML